MQTSEPLVALDKFADDVSGNNGFILGNTIPAGMLLPTTLRTRVADQTN